MKNGKFTATDIYELLMKKYQDERQWLCAGEVANRTGGGDRRLDFVACNCYASNGYGVHAFEIKISKADLRRELENPQKHNTFFEEIDTYSIVAPEYVLDAEYKSLIPKKWGIYTAVEICVEENGKEISRNVLRTVRKPLALHDEQDKTMRRDFAMSLLRAISSKSALCRSQQDLLSSEYQKGFKEGYASAEKNDWKVRNLEHDLEDAKEKAKIANELFREMGLWGNVSARQMVEISKKARKFFDSAERLEIWISQLSENIPAMIDTAKALKECVNTNKEGN